MAKLSPEDAAAILDAVQKATDHAIFLLDDQGHIRTWNEGARRIKGYEREEIVGKHFSIFYPPEDLLSHKPAYELKVAAAEGRYEEYGWRLRKNGVPFWANVLIVARKGEAGELLGFTKFTRDVTDRKQAEDALRRSEERYRVLVDSVRDYAIFLLDAAGRVRTWNRGAQEIKGYRSAEIVGEHISKFYTAEDKQRGLPKQLLAQAAHEGRVESEGWRVRKDGTRFWADVIITAIHGPDGKLTGFSKVTRDLTERHEGQLERSGLQRQAVESTEANRRLEAFSYTVAHDLKAPIRAVIAFADEIETEPANNLEPASRELLQRIRRTSENMGVLIEDLLNFSRSEKGDIHAEEVDLGKIAAHIHTHTLLRRDPARVGDLVLDGDLRVWGDKGLLRIVMDNLLSNAWKFTSTRPRYRIGIRKIDGDASTTVSVKDNGVGFPIERIDELFEPFKRLHASTEFPGTGVGLSTVQRIVARHGGRVWAESRPGEGATFSFSLPVQPKIGPG